VSVSDPRSARFDGGRLSSEGGLLALREIESRLRLADRLAACLKDPRAPERVVHRLAEIIRFRMLMIAAGYEDGDDADSLRADPMFKLAASWNCAKRWSGLRSSASFFKCAKRTVGQPEQQCAAGQRIRGELAIGRAERPIWL
jgi:hypothetical protein